MQKTRQRVRPLSRSLPLLIALASCGDGARFLLRTRVDREERVEASDPDARRFFGRVYGAQRAFAGMELARARAVSSLARSLELRPDADTDRIARALQARLSPDGGAPSTGFRARFSAERHADAVAAWSSALAEDGPRSEAFAALMARVRIRLSGSRCAELSPRLREVAALTRLALAQAVVADALAVEAAALLAEALHGGSEGPTPLRAEYAAAARWLESVPVRAELHRQAAEQTALWLRGVLNERAEGDLEVQESGCVLQ